MTEHSQIIAELQARWPEHQVARGLGRIEALVDLLGSPQRGYPVIQIAGTNGKGSTAIMVDSLLRALGLRTGRFTSPHLERLNERICVDGEPISDYAFDELVRDVSPLIEMVDARRIDNTAMTFYEVMTGLAYEAFAQAPVDVAVVEVGMGGGWDATSVADAQVAVVCPIDFDHTHLLGSTLPEIAAEKAGIIKPGSAAVFAAQAPEAAKVLVERAAQCGARTYLEGVDFALLDRQPGVGGQVIRIDAAGGPLGDLVLPLFGEHMAHNAALAVAAVEAFLGGKPLAPEVIAEGLERVAAPARMEVMRHSPTIVLDTCHNPHGVRATLDAMVEAFDFAPLIGVVAMMRDKDVDGVLRIMADEMTTVVAAGMRNERALPPGELAAKAAQAFGPDRVEQAPDMGSAIDLAVGLADAAGPGAGILIAGSVYAAGEARALLGKENTR
ncbi:MAG: bifunctional folylpolyglutamate synthase/dihydrofolate synthase [Propionibacteriaceae bacterium]|jgi:dihydrofolate synthase/folylpolyglutamate synthase|nr:bifunctional folylpolyglutamate synthase/dihydrofolate synthase [Propionibacteriaceae bacterium]